ncbi:MAG TPA: retropepsin-like aspartic protease, partial [Rubricoccaceae bacterium]
RVQQGAESVGFDSARVEVPLVGTTTLPLVEVTLNGRGPYRFLLDAGANVVSVKASVAREAGLPVLQQLSERSVVGVDSLRMGGVVFRGVAAVGEPELDVDGVIGFNLFREGLLTLDYPRQRLSWGPGSLPPPDGSSVLPYELRDRMPYVPVALGADTLWFNLDTGAAGWLYVPAEAEGGLPFDGPAVEGPSVWNQFTGGRTLTARRLGGDLRLGPHVVERPLLALAPDLTEYLVGSGLLQEFALTFDLTQRRIRMVRAGTGPIRTPE